MRIKVLNVKNIQFNYLAKYLDVELLMHMDILLLIFGKTSMLSSTVVFRSSLLSTSLTGLLFIFSTIGIVIC